MRYAFQLFTLNNWRVRNPAQCIGLLGRRASPGTMFLQEQAPTDWSSLTVTVLIVGAMAVVVARWAIRRTGRYPERQKRESEARQAFDKAHPREARAREGKLIAVERASNRRTGLVLLVLVLGVAVVAWLISANSW